MPGDDLVWNETEHHAIRLLQRPGEPAPPLRLAIADGDPLQPRPDVLLPHLRPAVGDHSTERPVVARDRHRDRRPRRNVGSGTASFQPRGEPEGPIRVAEPDRPDPWRSIRARGREMR